MADFHHNNMKKLEYSIHKCSSFAPSFAPENIREDKSSDQTSRWSSETSNVPQYLILKLESPSIIETVKFGKYEKTHICNLKKFQIYGGMTDICHIKLLESGLKNDFSPEIFPLKPVVDGHSIPCRYIKIVPLQCWGPSFNFTIWFVELMGIDDWNIVGPCLNWFNQYQEQEIVRLCLKHFRQHNYNEAFKALQHQTKVSLEDQLITQLHEVVVQQGSYKATEEFMEKAISDGYFNDFIDKQDYRPVWSPMPPSEGNLRPGMRGGHQMCIDPYSETVYLFGGWDGNRDMSDFWSYHVPTHKWTLISKNTEADGGPSSRSCHRVCLDPEQRQIFTLGRYLDTQHCTQDNLKSDFYMYDIESNTWTLITEDTASMGGPPLIFDHQMCVDVQKRTIYLFGGRVVTPLFGNAEERAGSMGATGIVGLTESRFSGLYSYHVPTNTWTLLCDDCASTGLRHGVKTIKSRTGHLMVFHRGYRKIYIFGGQRSREHLSDLFTYNVDTGEIELISEGTKREDLAPGPGLTQRATIDADLDEIYVLSGYNREKKDDKTQNSFWVYSINRNQWTCIYKNENVGDNFSNQASEPCPRFAHQLVYDHINKAHYLFGGNPGCNKKPKLRLDDFWELRLIRPSSIQLLQKFKFMIRKNRFEELAMENSLTALNFLQTVISDIIDHEDPEQTKQFQLLAAVLFQKQNCVEKGDGTRDFQVDLHEKRTELFDKLVEFFPSHMAQPKSNLMDLYQLAIQKYDETNH